MNRRATTALATSSVAPRTAWFGLAAAVTCVALTWARPAHAADAKEEAESRFNTFCSTCHGAQGKGDGPAGAALTPKPANFADPAFHAARTDDQLAKAIVEGGAAVGKNPAMPPNPQYKARPDVVKALVAKVRSFKAK